MPDLNIKFDRHGLGDCVHFAHALQLYKSRGFNVTVQAEENKLFVWKVAGVNIVQGGGLPDHPYIYPAGFDDLSAPDYERNKVAFGLRHDVMPRLEDLGLSQQQAWDELCAVRLSAHEHIPAEAHAEAERFLEGLPRPIICFHSRGTNWHERKSLPTDVAFDVILKLLEQTGGSVIVLDFDHRAPMVGHERCKGIKPTWGHVGIDRLCALYERCDLMIGVDSGPLHVASFTNIKTLGVFRSLHPNRVCLPNPNAVYLVSDQHADQWNSRRHKWTCEMYSGTEPTADQITEVASAILIRRQSLLQPVVMASKMSDLSGSYLYRRVGYDQRMMNLDPDGSISDGAGGCEQRWSVKILDGVDAIEISGKDGVICRCMSHDGKFVGRWTKFERMPIELVPISDLPLPSPSHEHIPGEYFCEIVGGEEFQISLHPDGSVTPGISPVDRWDLDDDTLRLSKRSNVLVTLHLSGDGCWRGSSGERRFELIRASRQPFRSFGATDSITFREHEFSYGTLARFSNDCVALARRLRPIAAIAGVPRSGVLAASIMALELNCPLIPIESLLGGTIPELPVPRRGQFNRYSADGTILVVDDNSHSGRVIRRLRPQLHPRVQIAVIDGNMDAPLEARPDYCLRPMQRDIFTSYEWTLFHDSNAEFTMTDMDGVLCEDWTGGSETDNIENYEHFLKNAKPRRIPSYEVLAIVTNRLEQHREQTVEWLDRLGIRFRELIMSPHSSFAARDLAGDAARRKANAYAAQPKARLFVESCGKQARDIKRFTGRPVLSIEDNSLV